MASLQRDRWRRYIVLVFVDFENKMMDERLDFYILTVEDWKRLLGTEEVKRQNTVSPDIKTGMIEEHKEKWIKIEKLVASDKLHDV